MVLWLDNHATNGGEEGTQLRVLLHPLVGAAEMELWDKHKWVEYYIRETQEGK